MSEADFYSQEAVAAMPWASSVVGTRGTVMVALGRYAEGITLLKRSMEDADKPASKGENACHLAIALARTGANEEAEKYVQLAEQLSPKCRLIDRAKRAIFANSTNPRSILTDIGV